MTHLKLERGWTLGSTQAMLAFIGATLAVSLVWASHFEIEEVARTSGQIIATARTQYIQAANDGVIDQMLVREGQAVKKGDVLARLERTQAEAAVDDSRGKVAALTAAVVRLRAEVFNKPLVFPDFVKAFPAFVEKQPRTRRKFPRKRNKVEAIVVQRTLGILAGTGDTGMPRKPQDIAIAAQVTRLKLRIVAREQHLVRRIAPHHRVTHIQHESIAYQMFAQETAHITTATHQQDSFHLAPPEQAFSNGLNAEDRSVRRAADSSKPATFHSPRSAENRHLAAESGQRGAIQTPAAAIRSTPRSPRENDPGHATRRCQIPDQSCARCYLSEDADMIEDALQAFHPPGNSAEQVCARCLACDACALQQVLELGAQPAANLLLRHKDERFERVDLALMHCPNCGHLQQRTFFPSKLLFDHYLYRSGTSQTLARFFDWLAASLAQWLPPQARVLELASNDGSFLDALQARGFRARGIDPARNLVRLCIERGLDVECDFWPTSRECGRYDAVVALNVLAHSPAPLAFLQRAADVLSEHGLLVVQVSQADMIRNGEFDTLSRASISRSSLTRQRARCMAAGSKVPSSSRARSKVVSARSHWLSSNSALPRLNQDCALASGFAVARRYASSASPWRPRRRNTCP